MIPTAVISDVMIAAFHAFIFFISDLILQSLSILNSHRCFERMNADV